VGLSYFGKGGVGDLRFKFLNNLYSNGTSKFVYRNKRNDILHRGNANITDQEMANEFKLFKEIAGRLEILFNKPNCLHYNFVDEFQQTT
jgi:hypothetical protein